METVKQDSNSPVRLNENNETLENREINENTFNEEIKKLHRHDRKMIKEFMKGFGNLIILWLISKKRQHGYEIMTQLHEASPFSNKKMPSSSMVYPVLHSLEKKGLIKGTWEHHGKRKVKYYEITREGEESLDRIRKVAAKDKELGRSNIHKEFMEDMFSLK